MQQIVMVIRKELVLEWRQKYALNGILLQVLSSVFVVFLTIKSINPNTWNGIFWIIMLFVSINAIAKSFIGEGKGRNLYYHGVVKPQNLLLAKFIYNSMLNCLLAGLSLIAFSLWMGNPIESQVLYYAVVFAGCIGFAGTFTMLSAIASKAGNSNLLMPVLSLPIIIPLLLILVRACKRAMDGIDQELIFKDLGILMLFNLLILSLAYLLFPAVWKE